MPRALVVSVDPCWPPISGADLRIWQVAQHVSAFTPATVACMAALPPLAHAPAPGITMLALSDVPSAAVWRRPPGATPIDITLPETARARLEALVADLRPDIALVESLSLHAILPWLSVTVPCVVLDMYDIESTRRARQAVGWLPWRRRQRTREVAAIRAIEKRAAESADRVWVCSSLDADRFTAVTGRRVGIHVVPNGVPRADSVPTQMRPRADSSRLAPVLLMAGHLAYRPNVLAAEFAARAILPRLRKHLPGARLVLAGRAPHRRVRALASDAVDVIADPPDMTPMLRDADMSVMPLTEGGGTRVKMAEAMAWGLPVVATAMAAEGLGLQDGRHYRRAESAAQFATAIAELWHDGPLFEATRQAAREFALREFGPDAIARAVARGLGGADPS